MLAIGCGVAGVLIGGFLGIKKGIKLGCMGTTMHYVHDKEFKNQLDELSSLYQHYQEGGA